jgi:hypothetical protein
MQATSSFCAMRFAGIGESTGGFWVSRYPPSAQEMTVPDRPQKITFAEMREMGVRGL